MRELSLNLLEIMGTLADDSSGSLLLKRLHKKELSSRPSDLKFVGLRVLSLSLLEIIWTLAEKHLEKGKC